MELDRTDRWLYSHPDVFFNIDRPSCRQQGSIIRAVKEHRIDFFVSVMSRHGDVLLAYMVNGLFLCVLWRGRVAMLR